MIKKVTKTTVYKISEENERALNMLKEAIELLREVKTHKEIYDNNYIYALISTALGNCGRAKTECEKLFAEKTTEEVEEIID